MRVVSAMPRLLPFILVVALLLVLPAAASATTTATRVGNAITITGDDGPERRLRRQQRQLHHVQGPNRPEHRRRRRLLPGDLVTHQLRAGGFGLKATVVLGGGDDTYDDRLARTRLAGRRPRCRRRQDTVNGSYGNDSCAAAPATTPCAASPATTRSTVAPATTRSTAEPTTTRSFGGPGRDSIYGDGDYSGTTLGGNDTIQARDGETDQVTCGLGADRRARHERLGGPGARLRAVDRRPPRPEAAAVVDPRGRPDRRAGQSQARRPARAGCRQGSRRHRELLRALLGNAEARRQRSGGAAHQARALEAHDRLPAGDAPAGTVRISLKVKKAYRSKLRRLKRLKTNLTIVCTSAAGATTRQAMPITLKR